MRTSLWITLAAVGCIGFLGCDETNTDGTTGTTTTMPGDTAPDTVTTDSANSGTTATADSGTIRPDNTGVNERDVERNTITPLDQGNNQADLDTTAKIRTQVLEAEGMSVNARNCKIVTLNGKVTLRGPVASAAERDEIERIAVAVAGAGKVDNQLEVAP
jgi:osmotically-inducible protein OsmY